MKKIIGLLIVVGIVGYVAYEALMYYDNHFRYGRMRQCNPGTDSKLLLKKFCF